MNGQFVMPDTSTPVSKDLKKEQKKLDKLYDPFLMKFFGSTGILPKAFSRILEETVMIQLIQLIKILSSLSTKISDKFKTDEKEEETDQEKKKKSWIVEKWQKIIKSNFFQKTLGFLKSLATVNFITQLLTFLVLLKMGIFQRFIPFIVSVIGDATISLIKFLPQLAKMFWKILTETAPKIFSEIFRTIFKTLGIENETLLKFSDGLAKILPMLLAGLFIFDKLSGILPIFTIVGKVFKYLWIAVKGIFTIVGKVFKYLWIAVKGIWFVIQMIALVTGIAIGWIILIIAAVVLIGVLVWKFRKEIWDFLKWIGTAFYKYVIAPITAIFIVLGLLFYDFVIKPIWDALVWVSGLFYTYIIKPVGKAIRWVMKKIVGLITGFIGIFKKAFKALTDFFYMIFVSPIKSLFASLASVAAPVLKKIQPIINFINGIFIGIKNTIESVFGSIAKTINELFAWFSGAGAFGGVDWMSMGAEKRAAYAASKTKFEQNKYVKLAQSGVTVEQAKQEGLIKGEYEIAEYTKLVQIKQENKDSEIADILAAQATGILNLLDGIKKEKETSNIAESVLKFASNQTGTKKMTGTSNE